MDSVSTTTTHPEPPEWMQPSEPTLADGAKKYVQEIIKKKSSRFSLLPFNFKSSHRKAQDKATTQVVLSAAENDILDVDFIDKRSNGEGMIQSDQYKWAIVYEHQRGLTIFSTPYYSSRSLLPNDPPQYTLPNTDDSTPSHRRPHVLPNITLQAYPLPDPTWRWVSKSWLVDMRGDGNVQHDGFEYNWFFRRHHWRARVGWLSAGGFVRRRRWVRLMMRPSDARLEAEAAAKEYGDEVAAHSTSMTSSQFINMPIWRGNSGDWERLQWFFRRIGRDGPKIDLWIDWLSDLIGEHPVVQAPRKQWTEDEEEEAAVVEVERQMSSERPRREWILAVLREHGHKLGYCFVYPDSRAQLFELFRLARLVQENGDSKDNQLLKPDFFLELAT